MFESRRSVLKKMALGAASLGGLAGLSFPVKLNAFEKDEWIWLNDGNPNRPVSYEPTASSASFVVGVNPRTLERIAIDLSFYGHEVTYSSTLKLATTQEKWGRRIAFIDLWKRSVVKEMILPFGTRFFGHSCFSEDGKFLYVSAMDDIKHEGVILVYNPKTFQMIKTLSCFGSNPHQIRLINENQLMVANSSGPSLVLVDIKRNTLVKEKKESVPTSHFSYEPSIDQLFVGGKPPTLPEPKGTNELKDSVKEIPKKDRGLIMQSFFDAGSSETIQKMPSVEILSIETDKLNGEFYSLVTLPMAGQLYLFNTKTHKEIKMQPISEKPRGVVFSKKNSGTFYVSTIEGAIYSGKIEFKGSDVLLTTKKIEGVNGGSGNHLQLVTA